MPSVLREAWGGPKTLKLESVARDPAPGEVRIRVRAARVNSPTC